MAGIVPVIAESGLPLTWQLRLLRAAAACGWRQGRLRRWARAHPQIAIGRRWRPRAWWGVAAGGVVQRFLADQWRRPHALALLESADWSELDAARQRGGVILATAHVGPPKFLMHVLLERQLPLLVWTNAADLPDWLPARGPTTFLDPLVPAERAIVMVKTAVHLRSGGVLLGAADMPTGGRSQEFERLGRRWHLSPGLPALARRLSVPTFFVLALWQGNRVRILCQKLEVPEEHLDDEAWQQAWLDRYWSEVEKLIPSSPENLRFLRGIDEGRFRRELGV
jgi:lauroyl/myristoyl acyltransferase